MKQIKRFWKSFHKNIIVKKKFKAYWISLIDKEYRGQINNLFELTKNSVGTEMRYVRTSLLVAGHKVIYKEYTDSLINNDEVNLEPIKVIESNGKFVVVDGNHRLPAILARAKRNSTTWTWCEVII